MTRDAQPEPQAMVPVYVAQNAPSGDEMNLIDLLLILLRSWRSIVLGTMVATGLAVVVLMLLPPRYRSRSTLALAVTEPQTLEFFGLRTDSKADEIGKHFASFFSGRSIINDAFAAAKVDTIDGQPLTVEQREDAVEVTVPKGLAQVEVAVTLPNPEQSAAVTRALVGAGLAKVDRVLRGRYQDQRDQADKRRDDAARQWKTALDTFLEAQARHQPERKARELTTLRDQRAKAQQEVLLHQEKIVELEASIAAMKETLGRIPETYTLKRSLADNPQVVAAVAAAAGKELDLQNLSKLTVLAEEANPTFRDITSRLANSEITYRERKALYEVLQKQLVQFGERIDVLLPEIERGQAEVSRADNERALAKTEHEKANTEAWSLRGRLFELQPPLTVLDQAVVPQKQATSRKSLIVVAVSLFSAFVMVMVALVRTGIKGRMNQIDPDARRTNDSLEVRRPSQ